VSTQPATPEEADGGLAIAGYSLRRLALYAVLGVMTVFYLIPIETGLMTAFTSPESYTGSAPYLPPLECYHTPNSEFVAGFIGEPSMNFFDVTVDAGTLEHDDFSYRLSSEARDAVGDASRVTLGIRPEDIEYQAGERSAGPDGFRCVVDVVEPMGDENNVYLTFADGDAETFIVTVSGMQRVESGQPVVARFPAEAIHLFDAETGEALKNRSLADVESVDVSV